MFYDMTCMTLGFTQQRKQRKDRDRHMYRKAGITCVVFSDRNTLALLVEVAGLS